GTATKWEWDFNNDGTVDKTDTSGASSCSGSYTYSAAGTYTVKLKVTSLDSTPNTPTKSVTIKEPPLVAKMSWNLDKDDEELTYDSTTEGASSWSWNFGDSGTSTLDNGTYTYTKSGKFNVKLTVKSPAGNTSYKTETVELDKVVAYFIPDKSSGSSPLTVKFTDESTENCDTRDYITKWIWDFGDGSPTTTITEASKADVEHTFTKEYDYDVTLTVTDGVDTDKYKMTIIVDDDSAPAADFDLYSDDYNSKGKAPLTVRFKDKSKINTNTNSTIDKWYWEFINEDGEVIKPYASDTSAYQNPPSYTFDKPGKYTIKLTVTDKDGASDTEIKEDFIEVTLGLSATFSAITTSGYKPLTVAFTASPGSDNDYAISKYYWEFGDGYTDSTTSRTASHTYTIAGTYTPKLTVTDSKGYTYTYKKDNYITVKDISQITAATTQATAAPTESLTELTDNSNGEKIFGLPGTEYFRDEMERFYSFYEEYLSLFAGIFGMK
ncbi:MAG: PKD domain-containing protein, partial [Methanomicrobium sp.]|nr:PKD domain-containing protein [Methanomicrobium sp.]